MEIGWRSDGDGIEIRTVIVRYNIINTKYYVSRDIVIGSGVGLFSGLGRQNQDWWGGGQKVIMSEKTVYVYLLTSSILYRNTAYLGGGGVMYSPVLFIIGWAIAPLLPWLLVIPQGSEEIISDPSNQYEQMSSHKSISEICVTRPWGPGQVQRQSLK